MDQIHLLVSPQSLSYEKTKGLFDLVFDKNSAASILAEISKWLENEKPERVRRSDDPLDPLAVFVGQRRIEFTPTQYRMFWYVHTERCVKKREFFEYMELGKAIWNRPQIPKKTIQNTAIQVREVLFDTDYGAEITVKKAGVLFI